MRTERAVLSGLALAASLLAAGAAAAQSCERPDQSHVVCRFVTSRPEPLHVYARGWLQRTGPRPAGELVLSVDGVPCEAHRLRGRRAVGVVDVACHGSNPSIRHVAEAELRGVSGAEPAGVLIALEDSPNLADLPRDERELSGPPKPPHRWLKPPRLPRLHLPHIGR